MTDALQSVWLISFAVDMFAIFSLRRPDILPVGKLVSREKSRVSLIRCIDT